MRRDQLFAQEWFSQWIEFDEGHIRKVAEIRKTPAVDTNYEPQYVFESAKDHLHLLLRRYSRGDPIAELQAHIPPLLDAWEEAERLGASVWSAEIQRSRHAWSINLDHYIRCFWLTGLALSLDIPDADWQRLLKLMGNEGEDALLDRVIASRQPGRKIGTTLCHPKPYQRLLDAVQAPADKQPALLRDFVTHWYAELDRPPKKGLSRMTAMYERPYWYEYDKADGAYFGFWCIEAVAAVKAFGMDDGLCLGQRHYPGDLLRPEGPTTHKDVMASADASSVVQQAKQGLGERLRSSLFPARS
jgi:Domain of unknown function (DUF1911)/Domain of unknown function (DUF1910)